MQRLGESASLSNRTSLSAAPTATANAEPETYSSHEFVFYRVDDITAHGFVSRQQKIVHVAGWRSASTQFSEERHARVDISGIRPDFLVKGEYREVDTNRLVYVGQATNRITEEELRCYVYKPE